MISIERVCKQPGRRRGPHTRGSLHKLAFYFLFPGRAAFPKSTSARAGALLLQSQFQRKLPLVPPFSRLSLSPAWHSFPRVPIVSSSQSRMIFHTKPRLFVPRPQNELETLTKMCWLSELCCGEVKKQLVSVLLRSKANRHLSPSLCSFSANCGISMESAGEGTLKLASEPCSFLRTVTII